MKYSNEDFDQLQNIHSQAVANRRKYDDYGWDTVDVLIGFYANEVKIADLSGAYSYKWTNGRIVRQCLGHPSKECEVIGATLNA